MQLDGGNYSDPVLHLIAFKKWATLSKSEQSKWAFSLGIRIQSMIEFVNTVNLLLEKVNRLLGRAGRDYDSYDRGENIDRKRFMDMISLDLSHEITARELNYFRLMLTWVSTDNIIRQEKKEKVDNEVKLKKQMVSVAAINRLFPVFRKASIIDDKEWRHDKYSIPFEISYEGEYVHRAPDCNDFIIVLYVASGTYLLFLLLIYSFSSILHRRTELWLQPTLYFVLSSSPEQPLSSYFLLCSRIHSLFTPPLRFLSSSSLFIWICYYNFIPSTSLPRSPLSTIILTSHPIAHLVSSIE